MISPEIVTHIERWLAEAAACKEMKEPTAMGLATATREGAPSLRTVLLKGFDARGFVFYTNEGSQKGSELLDNPHAAINFYWMPLSRQLRAEGTIERVTDAEADAYFASRRRESRVGAWASQQSRPLKSLEALEEKVVEMTARFEGKEVPRPDYWGGFRLVPRRIEFWQEGDFRLHTRENYVREGDAWRREFLSP